MKISSIFVATLLLGSLGHAQDPLPTWNAGPAKQAILDFVSKVVDPAGADYVSPPERIAVFDNDGTLWPENPMPFQVAFALDALREQVRLNPSLKDDGMVQAALQGDLAKLIEGPHHDGLLKVLALTHQGMTTEEFQNSVSSWLEEARHPLFQRGYDKLTYQAMQEVLQFLRDNEFKTFIVSGGGADFMRVFSERVYGIPPEQVIGSCGRTTFELRDDGPALVKTLEHLFVDDKAGKPVGIHQFIGRRPIACFGNSDGDQAMLEYTTIQNPQPSLGVIIHHTDGDREFEYDRHPSSSGKLDSALDDAQKRGWVLVDMQHDWQEVFSP